jgi:hypothetical protein
MVPRKGLSSCRNNTSKIKGLLPYRINALYQANVSISTDDDGDSRPPKKLGVDIGRIKAGTIRIEDIVSAGSGVRLKDAVAAGDFVVSGIRAGASDSPGKR